MSQEAAHVFEEKSRAALWAQAKSEAHRIAKQWNQDTGMWGHKTGFTVQLVNVHQSQPNEWYLGTAHADGSWTCATDTQVEEDLQKLDQSP